VTETLLIMLYTMGLADDFDEAKQLAIGLWNKCF